MHIPHIILNNILLNANCDGNTNMHVHVSFKKSVYLLHVTNIISSLVTSGKACSYMLNKNLNKFPNL